LPRIHAELLPFVVETCGGLTSDAIELLNIISRAAAEHCLSGHNRTLQNSC
jgi:hypothetical protein